MSYASSETNALYLYLTYFDETLKEETILSLSKSTKF